MTQGAMALTDDIDSEFELDLRVIEDSLPLAKMQCDTEDNCGNTTCASACTSEPQTRY